MLFLFNIINDINDLVNDINDIINEINGKEKLCHKPDCLLVVDAEIWYLFTKVLGEYY